MRALDLDGSTRALAEEALGPLLAADSPQRHWWHRQLACPLAQNELALVLTDGGRGRAVALVHRRPAGRNGRRSTYVVGEAADRQVLYALLNRAVLARLAALGVACTFHVVRADSPNAPLLLALGCEAAGELQELHWNGTPFSYPAVPGVRVERHLGGNLARSAEMARLCNRHFARETLWSPLDAPQLDLLAGSGETEWHLAIDEAADRAIGVAEMTPEGLFVALAVARSHWGTGVADQLGGVVLDRARERGLTHVISQVRPSNNASLALHRRHGWSHGPLLMTYRQVVPPPAPAVGR